MVIALLLIPLLIGLTAVFSIVAEWFVENKKINIIPATVLNLIAGIIFMLNYGGATTINSLGMGAAVSIILAIIILNLNKYGLKTGALASLAELVFSISAAFIIFICLVAGGQNGKKKRKK